MMNTNISSITEKIKKTLRSRFLQLGLPFFAVIIGGSFYLKQFTQLRYTYSNKNKLLTPEKLEEEGIEMKPREEVTLEKVYEEIKKVDIENWENKRIPRPWEDSK